MSKPKNNRKPTPSKNPVQEVLERARVLDRRRQAQIENQKAAINRLLERFDGIQLLDPQTGHPLMPPTSHAIYNEEMGILHGAYADAAAEAAELRSVLTSLVSSIDGTPLDGVSWPKAAGREALAQALHDARELLGLNDAVTQQEAPAG